MNKSLNKYEQALHYEIFEKKEYAFLDEIIKSAKVILDVGWHLGFFSEYCLLLSANKKDLQIHFFEPVKDLFKAAQSNLKKDKSNIIFNNKGLRSQNVKKEIFFNTEKTMQTSIYNQHFLNKKGVAQKVQFIRLDQYCNEYKIGNINLLKLDVEWSEFEILESLEKCFFQNIKCLFFEYHLINKDFEKRFKNILRFLETIYMKVEIVESSYSSKIGYVLAHKLLN